MSISDDTSFGEPGSGTLHAAIADRLDERTLAVHRFPRPPGVLRLRLMAAMFAAAALGATVLWLAIGRTPALGVLAVLLALGAAMWVSWCGQPLSVVRVEYGAVVVTAGDRQERIDVAGADLRISEAPGRRGWRASFCRPGRPPVVVDASMVDPAEFTRVLGRWRPDLVGSGDDARGSAPGAR